MILAGAAIAAIAAYFGIPAIIAACLSALAAGAGLCNWNSRGFILIYQSRAVFSCIRYNKEKVIRNESLFLYYTNKHSKSNL